MPWNRVCQDINGPIASFYGQLATIELSQELNVANLVWGFDFLPAKDTTTGEERFPSLDAYGNVSYKLSGI